jgi:P-type Ca2+ transporter type 2C
VNDDKEISPLPPVRTVPSNLVPREERTGHQNVATSSEEIVSETAIMQFEHDAEEDNKAAQNPFAFSPNTLDKLVNLKSLSAFYAFGGLRGLEIGLRTNRHCGLGVDETVLHGDVTFGDVKAALTGASISNAETAKAPSALNVSRSSSAHTHGHFTDRKRIFKDNRLPLTTPKSFLQLMWAAYNDKVLMLLTAAAIVSLAIGLYQTFNTPHSGSNPPLEWVEGVAIIVAIVIIVLVGSANDYKKERQFLKLNGTKQNRDVKVVRSGKSRQISVFEVLVGDVIHLEPGDVIPADGIFIDGYSVKCDESLVTGESDHIPKHPADQVFQAIQNGSSTELQTLDPFIISGSKVAEGVGTFLVTATGTNSSYGRFSESLNEDPEATPLQLRLERLAKKISIMGGILALVMFTVTFIKFCVQLPHSHNSPAEKGQNFLNVLIISLTVLVIAVPEGLPLAVTLALAFATTRMMKDNNLVRRLQSCETMGNATAICSDKTGTLTQNEMKVVAGAVGRSLQFTDQAEDVPIPNQKDESYILERGTELPDAPNVRLSSLSRRLSKDVRDLLEHLIAINSTAFEGDNDDEHLFIGSKTETALLKFARHYLGLGLVSVERSNTTTVYFMPFYANHQCMAAVVKLSSNKYRLYVKGAPEVLLAKSTRVVSDPTEGLSDHPITAEDTDYLKEIISTHASCSLRTMGLAYRDFDSWPDSEAEVNVDEILKDLVFLAVVGIQDPLRPDVKEAVRVCQHAGVVVRMVTGDNILTAEAIAKECGILGPNGTAMEGKEFRNLSRTQMDTALPQLRVIARASPEDKRLLVTALKDLGDVVAVTGDGTNDTLALAAADIGFSMGISGTEVAKEAAAIILMDDNFASIVKAIMWGRAINDAVKKFLQVCISMLTSRPS